MSKEQWNERYSGEEYIYGLEPNAWFRDCLMQIKQGRLLLPAEGEGRNAVFAASYGWEVHAFDQSEVAKQKALRLAKVKKVVISYDTLSLHDWQPEEAQFDVIAFIFVHMPEALRLIVHKNAIKALKPGGHLILEAFTVDQLPRNSGGPKNPDLLYQPDELIRDFRGMQIIDFKQELVELSEGPIHKGLADVVRLWARK